MSSKKWIILIIVALLVVLFAVSVVNFLPKVLSNDSSGEPTSELSSSNEDAFVPIMGDRITFTSTVLGIREDAVLVSARGALCWVSTTVQTDVPVPTLKIGDVIDYVHNGVVAESYPGQINFIYEIRLAKGEHPKLTYALSPQIGESKKTTEITDHNHELGCAIYYYGLEGMEVTVEEQTMSLQHALAVGAVSAEYLLEQAEADAKAGTCQRVVYKDGGSKLYRYEDYALLKMNTLSGDRSLYVGTPDLSPNEIKK